ncbi:MAG: hypothetical protein ACNI3A_11360 [Desulfovibrio sp.]|uniref:hypothetical protein n=1 Tax=Desulfovibrio sp. 7SRBS1 TaxID=3378064 RepID=UPI003B3C2E77
MIKKSALLSLLLLAITAVPVFAGKIEIRNYNDGNPYLVKYSGRVMEIPCQTSIIIRKGEHKVQDYVVNAIDKIEVYHCLCETTDLTCPTYGAEKVYTVHSSKAHRKFSVIIESGGKVQIDED